MIRLSKKLNSIPRIFILFLALYILFSFSRSFSQSLFIKKPDRLNLIFYGEKSSFLSFGFSDDVNYLGFFDNNAQIYLPGGYGRYRIGAVGRFVDIEKKPIIYQKSFSSALSLYVNYYFFQKINKIYTKSDSEDFFIPKLSPIDIYYLTGRRGNAGFLDRLYLFFLLLDKKRQDFSLISMRPVDKKESDTIFLEDVFGKKYKGYFYQKSLREEGKTVQILYKSYRSALIITRILEGEGISVVDLTRDDEGPDHCQVIENTKKPSQTAFFLRQIFSCQSKVAKTTSSDIIIRIDDKLSELWD